MLQVFSRVWKRRYIDALNRHRWLWRRRKISSAAIITFPARKAECALLLCVIILDEKCFEREAFTLRHEGKYWCVPLCCRDMFAPDGRAQAAIVIFHYAHLRDCSRCWMWKQWCCFFHPVCGALTTQFDIARQLPALWKNTKYSWKLLFQCNYKIFILFCACNWHL